MRLTDVVTEAFASIRARPLRTLLTMAGTFLGVTAVVTTLGLAETAGRQVSARFDALRATEVRLALSPGLDASQLPHDFAERLSDLNGVVAVGSVSENEFNVRVTMTALGGVGAAGFAGLVSISPGTEAALRFDLAEGRTFDLFHHQPGTDVAIVGSGVATQLSLPPLWTHPVVYVEGRPLTVVGVLRSAPTEPRSQGWIMVPESQAEGEAGRRIVIIQTEPGAAQTIARQAGPALRPDAPHLLVAAAPPDPRTLRMAVESDTRFAFLVAAGIVLLIGSLSIATGTLVAVLERTSEIGLRRAVGATPLDIASLVLTEATIVGALGGAFGASVGIIAVVAVASRSEWTPVLDPAVPFVAVAIGAGAGLLAGLAPAIRASRIEPVEALKR